ncbi:MAG: hypothetical protein VB018_15845 [Lachnospiraceae bacterium]|nr:hypothetical protein [Lachnospiraceae bacterium]
MAQINIDVAKEASVQTVNTKVGTYSDTASNTPTTLFAGIKGLIAWFTGTWTAARAAKVDTVDTNTAVNNTASKTGTISQKESYGISLLENGTYGLSALKTAITGGSIPIIKSVQLLVFVVPTNGSEITISISSVTTSKCLVLIDGTTTASTVGYSVSINSFASTSITMKCGAKSAGTSNHSCQIIEFY